jgi:hypothetical protein
VQATVKLSIDAPLFAGATKLTRSDPEAILVTVGFVGCAGAPTMIAGDIVESGPVPQALVASTVHR